MFITITTVPHKASDSEKIENFLAQFLPRVEKEHGVIAVYHYIRAEEEDSVTLIVWESREAWKEYIESPLKREVDEFMQEMDVEATREIYTLNYATQAEKMGVKA